MIKRWITLLFAAAVLLAGGPGHVQTVTTDPSKTGNPAGVQVIGRSAVAASITGTLTETTLGTVTVPAGLMGTSGALRITTLWTFTNSANTKTLKVKFGSGVPMNFAFTTTAGSQAVTIVRNRGAANSQVGFNNATLPFSNTTGAAYTSSIDTSASVDITFTATLANTGETITLESYTVEYLP